MAISKERLQEVKKMVLDYLNSKHAPKCASLQEIRKELQKRYPATYPNMIELHEIRLEPEFEFLKQGLYLTGILPEDMLCIKGHAEELLPVTPTRVYEKTEEVAKKIKEMENDLKTLRGIASETYETVEDIYYDIQKIKRKLKIEEEKE